MEQHENDLQASGAPAEEKSSAGGDGDCLDVIDEEGGCAASWGDSVSRKRSSLSDNLRISKQRRQSSLESRRSIPVSLLLDYSESVVDDVGDGDGKPARRGSSLIGNVDVGCLRRFFLNPSFPLLRQMLLTFGSVSLLALFMVMIVSISASLFAGDSIKEESDDRFEHWVEGIVETTSLRAAKVLSPKIMPNDLIDLMVEVAQDRFAGYPNSEDDSQTPFFDTQTQTNLYPLKNDLLPLDWDFRHTSNEKEGNVNEENYVEHVQDRWPLYTANPRLSTEAAMYTMQGACDPSVTNSSAMGYYPNCREANNNITTGGVIAPNPTNGQVYRKAADLSPFLKALYEYHDIKQLGYYFSNSGAGSSVFFPHYELDSTRSYESIGCDWMRTPNPIDPALGPIGSEDEISRCHPSGVVVGTREYNPLERPWCREQALNPRRVHNIGPYLDAWGTDKQWLMTAGRALYDSVTGAFVLCIAIDFTLDGIKNLLEAVKVDEVGTLTLVRNDDAGTVVISPNFDFDAATNTTTVDDPSLETGVNRERFNEIRQLVNFSQPWDPKEASGLYDDVFFDSEANMISAHPIPSIPDEYDPTYEPEFFAIFTLPMEKRLAPIIGSVSQNVDESVKSIIIFTVIVGLVGFAVVITLIYATASWLVEPLKWMHKVGDQVVGKFGLDLDSGIDYEKKKKMLYSPKTELSSLTEEFSKMVARFSGEGTAKRQKLKDTEKLNIFEFADEFAGLYRSREDGSFAFNYPKGVSAPDATASIKQHNLGPNTRSSSTPTPRLSSFDTTSFDGKVYKSPLFHWMVGLIVTPMLVTAIVISAVVLMKISNDLPTLVEPVKEEYFKMKNLHRFTVTGMMAKSASAMTEKVARDNYLLTRFSSWLYFGGLHTSESFVDAIEGAEECKETPPSSVCEWAKDMPCDCAWNDFSVRGKLGACTKYPPGESRLLQKVHFEGQSQDAGPGGSRYSTSFPKVASTPNATAWWDNITVLPKSSEGSTSSKYGTTHDRVRIMSALSTVFVPLYNYDNSNTKPLGFHMGFEADGMLAGYRGCDYSFVTYPFWRSTEGNGASQIRPELCPIGKYGFDSRCRGWYHDGKRKAETGEGALHITAPYVFAEGGVLGQSITSPLIDPGSQEHIGQVVVDFLPESTFRMLQADEAKLSEGGFVILITAESDILGHDVVIGPGFSLEGEGEAIDDLLSADAAFEPILEKMKSGQEGNGNFTRAGPNGDEILFIAYAPVNVRNYNPLNSSDIASGVKSETTTVYSLALVETEEGINEPFQSIEGMGSLSKTVKICVGVLSALIVVSAMLIVFIAFRVTASMTEPILKLHVVMKDINCMKLSKDDLNKLGNFRGSCREVQSVYDTVEMLYQVLQFANSAFFSGGIEIAYKVLRDALRLFTRLNNKKAIAVASNNLGNTMLTMYRTMKANGDEKICGMSKENVIAKGSSYFAHSIKLGEEAYDEFYNQQGWSEECLAFMQFLANRYFNRGVFFLTTSRDNKSREEAESLGFRDLQIAADMDVEIVDQCLEMGFRIDRVERYELMMRRVRGLLSLAKLGYSLEELCIDERIANIHQDLKNAMKNSSHELFKDMSVAGRMQKLDVELMKYFSQAKDDPVNAARVAIRMLIEDEYIFHDAEHEATAMLMAYMNTTDDENCPADENGIIAKELKSAIETLDDGYVKRAERRSSFGDSQEHSSRMALLNTSIATASTSKTKLFDHSMGEEDWAKKRSTRRISATECLRDDVTMELF